MWWIRDSLGPFGSDAKNTDADIMKYLLRFVEALKKILRGDLVDSNKGEVFVFDRGFFRAAEEKKNLGYRVLMPGFQGRKTTVFFQDLGDAENVRKRLVLKRPLR